MTPDREAIAAGFAARRGLADAFCRRHFSLPGSLRLHRAALGWDLLRAPLNVLLAPVFVTVRLLALVLHLVRLRAAARWLSGRHLLLPTATARRVENLLRAELLDRGGPLPVPAPRRDALVAEYGSGRSAVSEITTSLIVLCTGAILFRLLTPGVVSLAPRVAETMAQSAAVQSFPLGQTLGSAWYGVFPAEATLAETAGIAAGLAVLASVVTTFAGVLADPVQLRLGIHRRRILRLLSALEAEAMGAAGHYTAREHYLARTADLTDIGVMLLRLFRP